MQNLARCLRNGFACCFYHIWQSCKRPYEIDSKFSAISEGMSVSSWQLSLQILSSMPRIEEQWPLDFPKFRWGLLAELCERLGGEDECVPACFGPTLFNLISFIS